MLVAVSNCARASASPVPGSAAARRSSARIAQGAPAGAGRVGAVGSRCGQRFIEAAAGARRRRCRCGGAASVRARWMASGSTSCADLLRDVGLARERQDERREGGIAQGIPVDEGAERRGESGDLGIARPASRSKAASRRIATVCAACQRLNASVSCRSRASSSSFDRSSDDLHRGREAAEQGRHRAGRHVGEGEAVGRLVEA